MSFMITELPTNTVKCRTCDAHFPLAWVNRGQYGACRGPQGFFCSEKCAEAFKLKSTYRYEVQEARTCQAGNTAIQNTRSGNVESS